MVAQTKTLTYYLDWHDKAPQAESFIVSIGKRGINSVYWIVAVHRVEHRQPQAEQCYKLEVVGMQHLKPLTVHDETTDQIWVQGRPALPLFWHSRDEK